MLKAMAGWRMRSFKGKVIAVTGTVGKTSTKEAIFSVLNSQFKVLKSQGNMNSDFGLPLTILEVESGYSSAMKWGWLLVKAFFHCMNKNHNEIILLEMGVDKPGDMDFLLSIARPDISVITNITPVHMDEGQFNDLDAVFEEKKKIVEALGEEGVAVLNIDNPYLESLAKSIKKRKIVSFGVSKDATYQAKNLTQSIEGIAFLLCSEEEKVEVNAKVIGAYQVYVVVPAIICGVLMGIPLKEAAEAASRYSLPPGRMSVIPGTEGSIILDSSYNSSPEALEQALQVLASVGVGKRKVAVLGNMNELGEKSVELHKPFGKTAAECADLLLTVGKYAKLIGEEAKKNGLNEKNIFHFESALKAAEFFKEKVKANDLILVKGSQNNVRLEKFVKELMANPEDAKKILVRQGRNWG